MEQELIYKDEELGLVITDRQVKTHDLAIDTSELKGCRIEITGRSVATCLSRFLDLLSSVYGTIPVLLILLLYFGSKGNDSDLMSHLLGCLMWIVVALCVGGVLVLLLLTQVCRQGLFVILETTNGDREIYRDTFEPYIGLYSREAGFPQETTNIGKHNRARELVDAVSKAIHVRKAERR